MVGTGDTCASCGARVGEEKYCTACGTAIGVAHRDSKTAGAASTASAAPADSERSRKRTWIIVGVAAGVAALFMGGWPARSSTPQVARTPPLERRGFRSAIRYCSPAEQPANRPAGPGSSVDPLPMEPAEADAPPAPVYPVQASFTGVWTADPHTDTSNFHIVMDIVQDSTGTVTGTVRSTKSLDGSTSAWSVSGTAFGDSVVLARRRGSRGRTQVATSTPSRWFGRGVR